MWVHSTDKSTSLTEIIFAVFPLGIRAVRAVIQQWEVVWPLATYTVAGQQAIGSTFGSRGREPWQRHVPRQVGWWIPSEAVANVRLPQDPKCS